ncbi:hypothetical protein CYMTET_32781, partial [Cymbomonas tetramitiformis]
MELMLYKVKDEKRASDQQTRDHKAKKVRKLAKKLNFLTKQLSNSSSESEEESLGGDDEADSDTDGRSEYSRGPYFDLMHDLLEYVNQVKEVNADSLLKIAQSGDNVTDKYRFLMTFLDLHCNFDVDEGQFRDEASRKNFKAVVHAFQPQLTCRVFHGLVPATYRPKKVSWRRKFLVPPCCWTFIVPDAPEGQGGEGSRPPEPDEESQDEDECSDDEDLHAFFEGKNLLPDKKAGRFKCPVCPNKQHLPGLAALLAHLQSPGKQEPAKHR